MGATKLSSEEELLLTRIVLNRAMLGQCEGSNPPFLGAGQTLWAWFGFKSEQEVRDYLAQLLAVVEEYPRVQQAISQEDWYIVWKEGKYFLTNRKACATRLIAKQYLLVMLGIAIGMMLVGAVLKPLFFHKVLIFVVVSGFYSVVVLAAGLWLFNRFVRSLDVNSGTEPWSRTQATLLVCLLLVAVAIGVTIGILLAKEVRIDNNPWREEIEQTYPY